MGRRDIRFGVPLLAGALQLGDSVRPPVQMFSASSVESSRGEDSSSVDFLPPRGVVTLPAVITTCPRAHPRGEQMLPEGIFLSFR